MDRLMQVFLEGVLERAEQGDLAARMELQKQLRGPHAAFLQARLEAPQPSSPGASSPGASSPGPSSPGPSSPGPSSPAAERAAEALDAGHFRRVFRESPAQTVALLPKLSESDRLASVHFAIEPLSEGDESELGLALDLLTQCGLGPEVIQAEVRRVADAQVDHLLRCRRRDTPVREPSHVDFLRTAALLPEAARFEWTLGAGVKLAGVRVPSDYGARPAATPLEPWATQAAHAALAMAEGQSEHDRNKLSYLLGALGCLGAVREGAQHVSVLHVAMGLVAHGEPSAFDALPAAEGSTHRAVQLQRVELLVRQGRVEDAEAHLEGDSVRARLVLAREYATRGDLGAMERHWAAIARDASSASERALREQTRADIALRISEAARGQEDEASAQVWWHRAREEAQASVAGTVLPLPFAERFAAWRPQDGASGVDEWRADALAVLRSDGLDAALHRARVCPAAAEVAWRVLLEFGIGRSVAALEQASREAAPWAGALGLAAVAHLEDETRDFEAARARMAEAEEKAESVTDMTLRADVDAQLTRVRRGLSASLR